MVEINIGFGLYNQEERLITPRNIEPIKRKTTGNEKLVRKYSIIGEATNLPSPKPVIARPEAKPLWSLKLAISCLIGDV